MDGPPDASIIPPRRSSGRRVADCSLSTVQWPVIAFQETFGERTAEKEEALRLSEQIPRGLQRLRISILNSSAAPVGGSGEWQGFAPFSR